MVAFPAFLDTCVLYPAYLCDTLLRLAEASAYRPLWSADVFVELRRNLIDRGIPTDRVDRQHRAPQPHRQRNPPGPRRSAARAYEPLISRRSRRGLLVADRRYDQPSQVLSRS